MKRHTNVFVLVIYIIFFLVLFAQFPLGGKIAGNTDIPASIAFANRYLSVITAVFTGEDPGVFMYPAQNPNIYGESSFGTAAIFIIFKMIGLNDINAFYLILVTLFSLTAFSLFLLTKLYLKNNYAAIFSGLCFTCSNYTFGNIDDPFIVFFCLVPLCFYFLKKYFLESQIQFLYIAAIIAGLQVYFSAYLFLFLCFGGLVLLLFNFNIFLKKISMMKHLIIALFIFSSLSFPFFYVYLSHKATSDFYNPWNAPTLAQVHSLNPIDFARSLPNNLLYPYTPKTGIELQEETEKFEGLEITSLPALPTDGGIVLYGRFPIDEEIYFVSTRVCASLGIFIFLLAFVGIYSGFKGRNELVVMGILGVCLALGPGIIVFNKIFPAPMYLAYKYCSLSELFRMPSRAFFLTLMCICIFASNGLIYIIKKTRSSTPVYPLVITCLALIVFFIENVPFPLPSFEAKAYAYPPKEYSVFLKRKDANVILNLPSNPGLALAGDYRDLHSWTRECIYMNWQTRHKKNILNGVNGYFPRSRLEVQKLIHQLPNQNALETLINEFDLDYIIFHKNLVISENKEQLLKSLEKSKYSHIEALRNLAIPEDENKLLHDMRRSKYLHVELETDTMVVFRPSST